jgi:hypothetical protein
MNVSLEKFLKAERIPMARNTGGIKPNWNNIPHKGMTTLTKDEILAQLREIAKQEATAADDRERDDLAKKRQGLFTAYESFGSPDRKTLFDDALDTVKKNAGNLLKKGGEVPEQKDVFDFIKERDFKRAGFSPSEEENSMIPLRALGMEFNERYYFKNDGSVRAKSSPKDGINFEIFHETQKVMNVKRDGSVSHIATDEEKKLRKEITDFYNKFRNEFRGMPATPPPVLGNSSSEESMDYKV